MPGLGDAEDRVERHYSQSKQPEIVGGEQPGEPERPRQREQLPSHEADSAPADSASGGGEGDTS